MQIKLQRLMGANKNFKRNGTMNLNGYCMKMTQFHVKFVQNILSKVKCPKAATPKTVPKADPFK